MKRFFATLLIMVILAGCQTGNEEMNRAMAMRKQLLGSNGCTFDAVITADYGEDIYTFQMNCKANSQGALSFTVTEPETISGITGTITEQGGHLTFDDKALVFEMLADGQITPVTAPWILIKTLRSGYLSACGADGDKLHLMIDDSYEENALHLDIWLSNQNVPVQGDILWQGRRVVSLEVKNFSYL